MYKKGIRIDTVNTGVSQVDQAELQRCIDSPVYLYNKYIKKEGQREITEAEYNDFVTQVKYRRNMSLKLRSHYKDITSTLIQCYRKFPDFLKKKLWKK
jgi:hypothetical protein